MEFQHGDVVHWLHDDSIMIVKKVDYKSRMYLLWSGREEDKGTWVAEVEVQ